MLQWGRTLSSAEVRLTIQMRGLLQSRLQWGRTLSSAEVINVKLLSVQEAFASMGPHSFKCGSRLLYNVCSVSY